MSHDDLLLTPIRYSHGRSRDEGKTKLSNLKALLRVLRHPSVDNSVTYAQYSKLPLDERAKKKAQVGWYKLGVYREGIRKVTHLVKITGIAIDIDYADPAQIEAIMDGDAPIRGWAFIAYTTRSHCPEEPRVRILIPLTKGVSPDKANAIARYLATGLAVDPQEGIDLCDEVSFRNNQISYWPSISKNQDFWARLNEGEVVDPDAYLADRPGWEDITQLPTKSDESALRPFDPERQPEDPREKPGLMGAFCRAFSVYEVRDAFLSEEYADSDNPGSDEARWSFTQGGSSNGVIVYGNGRFIYSHHSSDPAGGQLCNAWDMLRLHKFGHLDSAADVEKPIGQRPSQKALLKFAGQLDAVKIELARANMDEAIATFEEFEDDEEETDSEHSEKRPEQVSKDLDGFLGDEHVKDSEESEHIGDDVSGDDLDGLLGDLAAPAPEPAKKPAKKPAKERAGEAEKAKKRKAEKEAEDPDSWLTKLTYAGDSGKLEKTRHKCRVLVCNDKRIGPSIGKNVLTGSPHALRPLRFKNLTLSQDAVPARTRAWTDVDTAALAIAFSAPRNLGGWEIEFTEEQIQKAMLQAAEQNSFDPVLDRIHKTSWDGVSRVETFFIDHLGTPDNPYYREAALAWFCATVGRLHMPGLKFDQVPILEGIGRIGKSGLINVLGFEEFFGELSAKFDDDKAMVESLRGKWILEVAELSGFGLNEVEDIKRFFSRQTDTIRLSYRRNEEDFPRRCTFMGSSNKHEYLRDPTGNGRFWPIHVAPQMVDFERLKADVPQLWAEAEQLFFQARDAHPERYPIFNLTSDWARGEALRLQNLAQEESTDMLLRDVIAEWLDQPVPEAVARGEADPGDVGIFASYEGDGERLYQRCKVSMQMIVSEIDHPMIHANVRNSKLLGTALAGLKGWKKIGIRRVKATIGAKTGVRANYYSRVGTQERRMWRPYEPSEDDADMLDDL